MALYLFSMWLSFVCCLTSFYLESSIRHTFLRWFAPFLFATALVETIAFEMATRSIPNVWLYNYFSAIEFNFYFLFFYQLLRGVLVRRIVLITVVVYPILAFTNIIFFQGRNGAELHTYTVMLGAILVIIYCMLFFYQVLRYPGTESLTRIPAFWITTGLLFFYACTFATISLTNYFIDMRYYSGILDTILQFANVFLYILISIGLLCKVKVRKSLA